MISDDPYLRSLARKRQTDQRILVCFIWAAVILGVAAMTYVLHEATGRQDGVRQYLIDHGYSNVRVKGTKWFSWCGRSTGYEFSATRPDGTKVEDGTVCTNVFFYWIRD